MNNPIRILHVIVNMNCGGAETLLMNLYRNIDRSVIQFDFLTCKEGLFDAEIAGLDGIVYRIPYITDVGHFEYIKELDNFFSSHSHYKIVHSHLNKMSGFVLRSAKTADIPVRIAHSHSIQSNGNIAARLYKWYSGMHISPCATSKLACSIAAAKWLFNKDANQACIVKNAIEVDKFKFSQGLRTAVRRELNIPDGTLAIGHVGRFVNVKNHVFIADIFAKFVQKKQNTQLILIGDGPLRSTIEAKINRMGLSGKVVFLGIRSDVNRLYQAIDVFLFPSLFEGLGNVLIEAQASGLFCIASDIIPREVKITDLVKFVPLSQPAAFWAEQIFKQGCDYERRDTSDAIAMAGYDIRDVAKGIEKFYVEQFRLCQ